MISKNDAKDMWADVALEQQLATGIETLGLDLPQKIVSRLLSYTALIQYWGQTHNLTAVLEPSRMVSHHLLDSLVIVPYVQGGRVIDIGSGAGLPGIPLAMALPKTRFTVLDSRKKKTRFLLQAKAELGLDNVDVVAERMENYRPDSLFDTVTARAVAPAGELLRLGGHLCHAHGRFLFLAGRSPEDGLTDFPGSFRIAETIPLTVPGVEGARRLIIATPR